MDTMLDYQLQGWLEYFELEPFGPQREDMRSGMVASAILNTNRTKKSDKVYSPDMFIMKFGADREKEEQPRAVSSKFTPITKEQFRRSKEFVIALGQALRTQKGKGPIAIPDKLSG